MTTHRKLSSQMHAFRIGDPDGEYQIWSEEGARVSSGRWHDFGTKVIYASEHFSTAMLEKLVYFEKMPSNQHYIEITIPVGTSYEFVDVDRIDGWDSPTHEASQQFGHDWYLEKRSAILIVPSVVARIERNILFNTNHEDYSGMSYGLEIPIRWDDRLFD